ncbi:MAG: aromatic amino acid lyase [Oligoflexia bacterium]|nr:aromatic amino acid lyase [Oligoflexia bacterium]
MIALGDRLSCQDLYDIAHGASVVLPPAARQAMADNAAMTPGGQNALAKKARWLVGEHARDLPPGDLPRAFLLGHCSGVGKLLPVPIVRAAMAARAHVLSQARSGCRPDAAQILVSMLEQGVHPDVPAQGSVGAAGDLAPMAHIAAVACGYLDRPAGLPAYSPTPKEALALINGISLSAAMAALAIVRVRRLLGAAVSACAMTMEAVGADRGCIDPRPLASRGHPGAQGIAETLRTLLQGSVQVRGGRLPDAFSIRAAPSVIGAAADIIDFVEATVETELNGVSDNPLLYTDADGHGQWVEAGNFHGAPIALAMDQLKLAIAQLATISERRTYRLSYGQLTPGLPSFLVPGTGLNSGFMLAQYTAASLTSEIKGLAHPASVDTIPTVQHHEDHNSMAPIAARTALECLECAADVVGIEALLAAQALDLRARGWSWTEDGQREADQPVVLAPAVDALRAKVRAVVPFWEDDGLLHPCLVAVGGLVRRGELSG